MEKHDEYYEEVDNRIRYFVTDMNEELDNIERLVRGNESAVLLLQWVRDTMHRVAENYER
jgi:hypothetical protein